MAGTRVLLRGHYNPTNWTRKYPNLQKTRLASGVRALVCTQCLRSQNKPVHKAQKPKASAPVESK